MKNILQGIFALTFCAIAFPSNAQDKSPYEFKVEKNIEATEAKDQYRTGTCWSFATASFMESELIRMGKGTHDLSEMFNVRVTYPDKAERYIRLHGKTQFGPGSLSHDVINAIEKHGMVPESAYSGLNYGTDKHNHGELDALMEGMVKALIERKNLTENWDDAIEAVLDAYLGDFPESFMYNSKMYTPESFRDEMGVKADDYISITSFTHHPFYKDFVLEVPDNFSQGSFYNLPLDEMISVIDHALDKGYTIAWDADVSETGFSFGKGVAIMPEVGLGKQELWKSIVSERKVDQASRQIGFENYQTTDDHLMHITGIARDQKGNKYYITKNSWGQGNDFEGYQYVSEAYIRMKTVGILLHKTGLPKEVSKKLGL